MAPQRLAAMLASLLLIPVALAAPGDLDAADPAGDERVTVGVAPMPDGSCDAPPADIVALRLRTDPRDLSVTLTVRDPGADLTCGDTDFGPAFQSGSTVGFTASGTGDVHAFWVDVVNVNATMARACWSVSLTAYATTGECRSVPRSELYDGAAWTWDVPLEGTAEGPNGTVAYDLRDETYAVRAGASSMHGTSPLPVARAIDGFEGGPYAL